MENNWLDIQHRGFAAYLDETENEAACKKVKRLIMSAAGSNEKIDTVFRDCQIETDWIEQIEKALPYLEKAVREGRQFIIRHGQVVPIEKIKRVSRSSVEHLSRHSELITTEPPEGAELMPDKLLMTENTGTSAVYENRFLYMLLCMARDFAGSRYRQIMASSASVSTDLALDKKIDDTDRTIAISLHFSESSKLPYGSDSDDAIGRIKSIVQTLELLLRMPLMVELSREPMLRPPITRTNVMQHDPNFREAYDLYQYIAAYEGTGFSQIERTRTEKAHDAETRNDLATLVAITSYLSYRCGGLREVMNERLAAHRAKITEAESRKRQERIAQLRSQLGQLDEKTSAYILELEGQLAETEHFQVRLAEEKAAQAQLQLQLESLQKQHLQLQSERREQENLVLQHKQKSAALLQENDKLVQQCEERLRHCEADFEKQKQEMQMQFAALEEKYHLASALSLQLSDDEDLSDRESFARLDAQYQALRRFRAKQWKKAKKRIRKELLWKK